MGTMGTSVCICQVPRDCGCGMLRRETWQEPGLLFLGRSRWGRRRGLRIGRAETPQWMQLVMHPLGM